MINIKAIEMLMQNNNLSLAKLSLKIGIQKSTLSRIINGHTHKPNSDKLRLIADYFSIPLSELLVQDEEVPQLAVIGSSLTTNLRTLMIKSSIFSAKELSQQTGIATSNIERILKGTSTNPHLNTLNELANFFGITISQLKGDEAIVNACNDRTNPIFNIPLIKLNQIESWLLENNSDIFANNYIECSRKNLGAKSFSVMMDNNIYYPEFKENYNLVIDSASKPDNGDYIVAAIKKQQPTIFEFYDEEEILLRKAGTENYEICNIDEINIFGVIVEIKLK